MRWPSFFDIVVRESKSSVPAPSPGCRTRKRRIAMKKLTLSFWLALATASFFVIQSATPTTHQVRFDDPLPTCPPLCPPADSGAQR